MTTKPRLSQIRPEGAAGKYVKVNPTGDGWVYDIPAGGSSGSWTAPTLLNSFTDLGTGYAPSGYRSDSGWVSLRGIVTKSGGWSAGTTIFTLPAGYRPEYKLQCVVSAFDGSTNTFQVIEVQTGGNVNVVKAFGAGGNTGLDGVRFVAFA